MTPRGCDLKVRGRQRSVMDVFPRMVADLPGPIHSLTSRRRGWGRHNSWAPRWGLSSEEGCHSLPQNRIPPSPPLEEREEGRGAGPAGNAQLGPGDTAGREGGVTPAGHQELGGGSFFSYRDKGNRDPGGGRDPRPRKEFPRGCEFSPSSWHCPEETPLGTFQRRPCPPSPGQ